MGDIDKVVVITGASRGLGAALAKALDARGARLVLGARSEAQLRSVAAACRAAVAVPGDVRDPDHHAALLEAALQQHGQLDVWINNAGLAIYGPATEASAEHIDAMIDTNVKGVIHGSIVALRHMQSRQAGHILNIGSIAGKLHLPRESVYNASKWAVTGYTGTLRLEAERHGVKVTHVAPGGIDTPFWHNDHPKPFPSRIEPVRDFMSVGQVARSVVEVIDTPAEYAVPELVMTPLIR